MRVSSSAVRPADNGPEYNQEETFERRVKSIRFCEIHFKKCSSSRSDELGDDCIDLCDKNILQHPKHLLLYTLSRGLPEKDKDRFVLFKYLRMHLHIQLWLPWVLFWTAWKTGKIYPKAWKDTERKASGICMQQLIYEGIKWVHE